VFAFLLAAALLTRPDAEGHMMKVRAQAIKLMTWLHVLTEVQPASVEVTWFSPADLRGTLTMCPVIFKSMSLRVVRCVRSICHVRTAHCS
jgi:hypothetical protein